MQKENSDCVWSQAIKQGLKTGFVGLRISAWERGVGIQKNNPYDFGRMGILLIVFSGELVSNWYPVSIFEEPKGPKSLAVQGFSCLVICGWGSPKRSISFGGSRLWFHCWEKK